MGPAPPPSTATRRSELADFLRDRRARVAPASAGLPADGRRRTPGLRREEVAQLAGVGLSWYTWLEQGRDIRPSPQVLDALSRVLRLDEGERAHLFHLARVERPLPSVDYPREAPPELHAIVEELLPNPAYLIGPRTDVLAWNRAAAVVLGEPTAAPDGRPNLLWWLFTARAPADPRWEATARAALARFRAEHARRLADPSFAVLLGQLQDASSDFRAWWARHEVLTEQLGSKHIDHPELGPLRLHHLQSAPTSHPDLRLTQFTPADERTRAALAALRDR